MPAELAIPFVPQFIWAYLSMYVLFFLPLIFIPTARMPALGKQLIAGTLISAVLFLLLPAELGFVRNGSGAAPYAALYAGIFGIDHPFNLVPSLHVIYATAITLACADFARPPVRFAITFVARRDRRLDSSRSSASSAGRRGRAGDRLVLAPSL